MTSSLSSFNKWGHRRKKASSACDTTLWEDAELGKCHWETGRQEPAWGPGSDAAGCYFTWNSHLLALSQDRKMGKEYFFSLKNSQNKTKKCLKKATPSPALSKPVLREAVRCLSGIDVYSYYSDYFEDQFPYSPNTIAFLFYICQAQYLSKCSCSKLWNMYG